MQNPLVKEKKIVPAVFLNMFFFLMKKVEGLCYFLNHKKTSDLGNRKQYIHQICTYVFPF